MAEPIVTDNPATTTAKIFSLGRSVADGPEFGLGLYFGDRLILEVDGFGSRKAAASWLIEYLESMRRDSILKREADPQLLPLDVDSSNYVEGIKRAGEVTVQLNYEPEPGERRIDVGKEGA